MGYNFQLDTWYNKSMLEVLGKPKISSVAVHHFGGTGKDPFASTQNLSEAHIEMAHKNRWPNFPSQLNGSFIGYNVIIWPDGSYTQYRFIGEETAAQRGYNDDVISICPAGNFTRLAGGYVDTPTDAQIKTLGNILEWISEYFTSVVRPHRWYSSTECYGNLLSDKWASNILAGRIKIKITLLQRIILLWRKILSLRIRLGGSDRGCSGYI